MPPRTRMPAPARRPRVAGLRDPRRPQNEPETPDTATTAADTTTADSSTVDTPATDTSVASPSDASPSDASPSESAPPVSLEKGDRTAPATTDATPDDPVTDTAQDTDTAQATDRAPATDTATRSDAATVTDTATETVTAPPTPAAAPTRPGGKRAPATPRRRPAPATGAADRTRRPAATASEPGRLRRGATAAGAPFRRLGRSRVGLPVTLAVATVVLGLLAGLAAWQGHDAWTNGPRANTAVVDAAATAEVVGQTRQVIEQTLAYDYTRLDDAVTAARTQGTGDFPAQYTDVINQVIRPQAVPQQLKQTATVLNIGVRSIDGDKANVMALVQFSATRGTTGQSTDAPGLLSLDMQRVDGRWKLAKLQPLTAQR